MESGKADDAVVAVDRVTSERPRASDLPSSSASSLITEARKKFHFHGESCYAIGPGDTEVLVCGMEGRQVERDPIKRLHNFVDMIQCCDKCEADPNDIDGPVVLCGACHRGLIDQIRALEQERDDYKEASLKAVDVAMLLNDRRDVAEASLATLLASLKETALEIRGGPDRGWVVSASVVLRWADRLDALVSLYDTTQKDNKEKDLGSHVVEQADSNGAATASTD